MVEKRSQGIVCTDFSNGKKHDFKLFKESRIRTKPKTTVAVDSGYTGIKEIIPNSKVPHKKTKKKSLTKEQKRSNREIAKLRVLNENVIGKIKRFKVIAERYRNRRKRFGLRFNLISGIYNFEMGFS